MLPEEKNGSEGVGASRGGPTTKINVLCDALGNPVRIVIGEGQRHDLHFASALVEGISGVIIIGDKGYDANAFVEKLEHQGCQVVIPSRVNRTQQRDIDLHIYQFRTYVEVFFQRIKRYRRISTRFEKLSVTYMGMVLIASTMVWLR